MMSATDDPEFVGTSDGAATEKMKNSSTVEALTEVQESMGETFERAFNPNDERDLQVVLDQPQKHVTSFETYISYRVSTKSSRAEYDQHDYVVRRRYSDFEWLRNQLAHDYATHIIPPLPEKHSLFEQIDRYDRDFISSRMQLLHRFLNRIADHPVLSCDKKFKAFLVETPHDFTLFKKSVGGNGLFVKMSESLQNLATSYVAKGRTVEFEKMNDYLKKLGEKINTMEKIGQRIQKERIALLHDLNEVEPLMAQWSTVEPVLAPSLKAVGEAANSCFEAQRKLIELQKHNVAVPLHEYALYSESGKDAMRSRDNAQMDYEVHMEQLSRVKAEKTQLETAPLSDHPIMFGMNMWRSPEQAQQLRLQQLSTAAATLATQVETSRDKMECANENLRADFERWNRVKSRDLKKILEDMADLHIAMYEQSIAAWAAALPAIRKSTSEEA